MRGNTNSINAMNAMNANSDTITAISTPLGEGGIGVVRLSGPEAVQIAGKIVELSGGKDLLSSASHTVQHGFIRCAGSTDIIDEVMVAIMKAPKSYTTEDVVEINCHGGFIPLKRVLGLCIENGARTAEPGEFTKRAFLNGRIDLTQAEAVLDVIKAQTEISEKVAARQLSGALALEVRSIREIIVGIISSIELTIDFSDEDVKFSTVKDIQNKMEETKKHVEKLLATSGKGMILRKGANIVICGKPNVGKSSLMNALLKHDRVIVTPIAGTTRDVIEESIDIAGVGVRISDTAGIIETEDRVEIEGIKRSRQKLEEADLVLFLMDWNQPLSDKDEDIYRSLTGKKIIVVANKSDLHQKLDTKKVKKVLDSEDVIKVSALKKKGLEALEDKVADKLFNGNATLPEGPLITNIRHKEALEKAYACLKNAENVTGDNYNGELLASDLKEAVNYLGLITGETIEDDILDRIFSEFCIGK